jgi:hypothetical protein
MNIADFVSTDFLLDGGAAAELPSAPKVAVAETASDLSIHKQDLIAEFLADTAVDAPVIATGNQAYAQIITDDDMGHDWDGFAVL